MFLTHSTQGEGSWGWVVDPQIVKELAHEIPKVFNESMQTYMVEYDGIIANVGHIFRVKKGLDGYELHGLTSAYTRGHSLQEKW